MWISEKTVCFKSCLSSAILCSIYTLSHFGTILINKVAATINYVLNIMQTQKPVANNNQQLVVAALKQARQELAWAKNLFNAVADKDLLDYYVFQMLAAERKYSYYLRLARLDAAQAKASLFGRIS